MNMDKQTYARYVEARAPRSPLWKNCLFAFLIGGGICLFAEGLILTLAAITGMPRDAASLWEALSGGANSRCLLEELRKKAPTWVLFALELARRTRLASTSCEAARKSWTFLHFV